MTKFVDALQAKISEDRRLRALETPICLGEPFFLTEDFVRPHIQELYTLNLRWGVSAWIDKPAGNEAVQAARNLAIKNLKRVIYGEIIHELHELHYMIDYGDKEHAKKKVCDIFDKIT